MTTDPILPPGQATDDEPEALFAAALEHQRAKRLDQAVAAYHRLLELHPECVEAYDNLGVIFRVAGDLPRSIAYHRYALTLHPEHASAYSNLGTALLNAGEVEDAERAFRCAVGVEPANARFHFNLGLALHRRGRLPEAVAALRDAIACDPGFAEAHNALGTAWAELRRPELAIGHKSRALDLRPGYARAHFGRALSYLLAGDYERGWEDYEWRWREPSTGCRPRSFRQPLWTGEPLEGRRILVHAEQGFGDAIQMARYAALLAERGARVIVECRPELRRLFAACPDIHEVAVLGRPLPAFDLYVPAMSLPRVFGTRLHSVPAAVPYLRPPAEDSPAWVGTLRRLPGRRVGLAWAGSPDNRRGVQRSLRLAGLRPLLQQPGLSFVSLQKGPAEAELDALPGAERIVRLGPVLRDFADTACAVRELDLVVTIDTSVAHLAGALAVPTWVLLAHNACWRWGLDGSASPWYPTARLFRQPAPGDWDAAVEEAARALDTARDAAA